MDHSLAALEHRRAAAYYTRWSIDHSTPNPILTFDGCSVIQDDEAKYVLNLILADQMKIDPLDPPLKERVKELLDHTDCRETAELVSMAVLGKEVSRAKPAEDRSDILATMAGIAPNGSVTGRFIKSPDPQEFKRQRRPLNPISRPMREEDKIIAGAEFSQDEFGGPIMVTRLPTHYVLRQFVKDADFYISQGGLSEDWGQHWRPVIATGFDDARKQAV